MAGAGYKLFNTGDVLTAAQVNTYLMEQTVMVFADAAARTTALSGVVSEGMISYLKDTNAVEVYDGSNWVSSDDPNAIQNTIVDAKGDLITATAADTPSRIAVGNNGETLVADSSASTGLRWQGNFAAGKNKIINGDFHINQRGFTSNTADSAYNFDRWVQQNGGTTGTLTITPQTFTTGSAPVAGYEGKNFVRCTTASGASTNTYAIFRQKIESVRTFANQVVTVSFWAKASSGTPKIMLELEQVFGGGGGSTAVPTNFGSVTLSTSWVRYSVTSTIPSISGKTVGTANDDNLTLSFWLSAGSDFNARTSSLGLQNATFDIWGVQIEAGSVATPFQTATGTLAGELAACQRYYQVVASGNLKTICYGSAYNSGDFRGVIHFNNTMRTAPTIVQVTGTNYFALDGNNGNDPFDSWSGLTLASDSRTGIYVQSGVSMTQGYGYSAYTNNASASLALNAEL